MDNADKLLVFAHSPGLSGAERSLLETLELLKQEHEIQLVVPGRGAFLEAARRVGLAGIHVVPQHLYYEKRSYSRVKTLAKTVVNLWAVWRCIGLAARLRPALVYSNSVGGWTGALVARLLGIPHVWHLRELPSESGIGRPVLGRRLQSWLLQASGTRFLFNSCYVRDWYRDQFGIDGTVAYQPVQLADSTSMETTKGPKAVISVFGRLQPQKRQHVVLEAVALLPAHVRERTELRFYGSFSDSYVARLNDIIRGAGLEDAVQLKGFTPDPGHAIASSDLVVTAAVEEGFGRVCAEALLLGIPVIGAASGATTELLGQNANRGALFPADDPIALSRLIGEYLDDPGPMRVRAQLAKEWVQSALSPSAYSAALSAAFTVAVAREAQPG